jgi:phosphoribosylglycinamide formyltransferase-1
LRTLLFVYDFPHQRSCDFIVRMLASPSVPGLVVGAPWRQLAVRPSRFRVLPQAIDAPRAGDLCRAVGIPYVVADHASSTTLELARRGRFDLGVVAAARILPEPLIGAFPRGILNVHPGLIPENRGLDTLTNAIYRDIPMGITAHLIDRRVDAGAVLDRYLLPVHLGDTPIDLGLRMSHALPVVLVHSLERLGRSDTHAQPVARRTFPKNVAGDPGVDACAARRWADYVCDWAHETAGWRCVCGEPIRDGRCGACGRMYQEVGSLLREVQSDLARARPAVLARGAR